MSVVSYDGAGAGECAVKLQALEDEIRVIVEKVGTFFEVDLEGWQGKSKEAFKTTYFDAIVSSGGILFQNIQAAASTAAKIAESAGDMDSDLAQRIMNG